MNKPILSDCLARAVLLTVLENYNDGHNFKSKLFCASMKTCDLRELPPNPNCVTGLELRTAIRHAIEKVLANYNHTDSEEHLMP